MVQSIRGRAVVWLVVFSTLAWIPGGFSRFVFPKLALVALACVLAVRIKREANLPRPVVLLTSAGLVVLGLAALASEAPLAGLIGRWPRYEGLPVIGLYVASAWLGARALGAGHRYLGTLVEALSAMSLVLFALSLLEKLGASPLGAATIDRPGAALGNATDQAAVAMMAAAVLLHAFLRERSRLVGAGVIAALGVVALSGSRAGIAITLVVIVALSLTSSLRRDSDGAARLSWTSTANLRWGGVAVLALIGSVLAVPATRDRLLGGRTFDGRLIQWRLTGDLVSDHPLLGVGPSGYQDAFGPYESSEWVAWTGARLVPDSPHSWPLQALVAGGIPLLVIAVALAGLVLTLGVRAVRTAPELTGLLAAVAGYGALLLINFTVAGATCLAAFLAGALVATTAPPTSTAENPSLTWLRPVGSGLAAVALLVTVTASLAELDLQQGIDAAARGEIAQARASFDSAHALRPYDSDIDLIAAQALAAPASDGDAAAATAVEEYARSSLRRTPQAYAAQVALGVALVQRERLGAARDVLDTAVNLAPLRAPAYVQRAIARFGLGDLDGARTDLRRAIELAPRDPTAERLLEEINRRVS